MRVVTGIALSTFLLTTALFAGMGRAAEKAAATSFSARDLQAKLEYCKTCHGLSGQGYRGSFPMPRLAGQQTEYFENQLRAFIEHRRENRFMFQVAHVLTPEMLVALAAHFRDLNPKPVGGAPRNWDCRARKFMRRACRVPTFPPAPIVTARMPRAMGRFRA